MRVGEQKSILFFGYWNLSDPLTKSTIIPHLKILKDNGKVQNLIFANLQREPVLESDKSLIYNAGVDKYIPLYTSSGIMYFIRWFFLMPFKLRGLLKKYGIELIIARGAPAGALVILSISKMHIPFIVESFEPHAEYMKETGVWNKYDARYLLESLLEEQVKMKSTFLMTVSALYKEELIREGISAQKILVAPCAVDGQKFFISYDKRESFRKALNIAETDTVGIYLGKFGGLYYDELAFELFLESFNVFGDDFHIVILSPENQNSFWRKCKSYNLPKDRISILFAKPEEVNNYLNVADFGYAFYKKTLTSSFLSPVKLAEYWAVGLPVLLTENVGDEQMFLEKEGLGKLIDMENKSSWCDTLELFRSELKEYNKNNIREKGLSFRSFETIHRNYMKIV